MAEERKIACFDCLNEILTITKEISDNYYELVNKLKEVTDISKIGSSVSG